MANNHNLKPYEKGISGNKKGRPKGSKNRAKIIREIFDSITVLDIFDFEQLQAKFPHIENNMSIEYLMTLIQVNKAIYKGDTKAYKVLMDSLYGTPIKQIDLEANIVNEDDINNSIEFNYEALTDDELRILIKAFDRGNIIKED